MTDIEKNNRKTTIKIAGRRRVYLMRHGHVDYFDPKMTDPRMVSLTEEGQAQAQAAASALAPVTFDIAMHSTLPRTAQTAEIVLANKDKSRLVGGAVVGEPLFEELKSGWIKADTREELAARLAFCFDDAAEPGARFLPDGETFAGAQERIIKGIQRLITEFAWKTALLVAHEGVNRILLGWASGGGLRSISSFEQDLGCINVIDFDIAPAASLSQERTNNKENNHLLGAPGGDYQIERAIIKALNITPYDYVKHGLSRTSLEHLFDVDFGKARPTNSDFQGQDIA
ncbi:MAG: histidine phosphatase family protein [Pseudomonadota bacterium]